MGALFTVDWESYFNAVIDKKHWPELDTRVEEPTMFLLEILDKYEIKAIWYCLGWLIHHEHELFHEIQHRGHKIGWHSYWHEHNATSNAKDFRSPYWDTTPMPFPPSGGFFFRAMPYEYVKWATQYTGQFWIHPHDIDEGHPELNNPILNIKRHIGLKDARSKLDRLLSEISWDAANRQTKS